MKKLQYNYTTIEQSKKLLELGVPEWTADVNFDTVDNVARIRYEDDFFISFGIKGRDIPCWSVGRLIEIIRECATDYDVCQILIETLVIPTTDNVDVLIRLMTADEFKGDLDFSKLED